MTVILHAPPPPPSWLPSPRDLVQALVRRHGTSCVLYNSQGLVLRSLGYNCRVSLCPHRLVYLRADYERTLFVGVIFIGVTNFPQGPRPRGLPLAE
jgi:hypothetical protein